MTCFELDKAVLALGSRL